MRGWGAVVSGPEAATVYIGLGANLGECESALRRALKAVAQLPATQLLRVSSLYGSAPVDASGPDYLNAVAQLATGLAPQQLLEGLQAIEQAQGRERPYRNAPRTLDLDILFWDEQQITTPTLNVPHPRWHERAFVLYPLAELAPQRVPASVWNAVADQRIERLQGPHWADLAEPAASTAAPQATEGDPLA